MKQMHRLTALLLGAAMLGSAAPGMPVTAAEIAAVQAEAAASPLQYDGKTVFLERIAGWENVKLSDCVVLENGEGLLTLLTPNKSYSIGRSVYMPYSVYMRDCCTLDQDAILAKWKEMLLAAGFPEKDGELDRMSYSFRKTDDCYQVKISPDGYGSTTMIDLLKAIPEIDRVEAKYLYQTHSRVNSEFGYRISFKVDGTGMPKPEDFPELTGVQIAGDVPLETQTESRWTLTLESGKYEDYFAAVKYLQTLDFVHDLSFACATTCLADTADDAYFWDQTPTVLFDRSLAADSRTELFEHIAGWQNTTLGDCVILGENELLTPDKPYHVSRVQYTPYCVYTKDGEKPDTDAIAAKWTEMLRAASYPEANLAHMYCKATETNGGYELKTLQSGYAGLSLLDCLKTFPDAERVEAQFGYHTDDRPNGTSGYAFSFKVDGTEMPQPGDFPGLTGVQIAGDVPETVQTESTWSLKLESDKYEDYFAAAKYLLTLDFVRDLHLNYISTCLGDPNDDAKVLDPAPTVIYRRAADSETLTEHTRDAFFKAIASREQVVYDACIRLGDNELLTPNKPYTVSRSRFTPYTVYLREGGSLDADAVLAKWKKMLLAKGYPEETLENFECRITETNGAYEVSTTQDGFKTLSLTDCLKTFPDVQRIGAKFGYRSDDFANTASDFAISFRTVIERTFSAADFPELDISDFFSKQVEPEDPNEKYFLTLNSTAYADYFAAVQYLMQREYIYDVKLDYMRTEVAMENEPRLADTVPTELFSRGDLNLDGYADVADAVLLARYAASDAEAVISDQGMVNADVDGDGSVRSKDLTALLKRIAKKY